MSNKEKKSVLWYVAGPMTGIPQFNIPAFLDTQARLQSLGYDTHLPADLDDPVIVEKLLQTDGSPGESDMTWGQCLALDVELISDKCGGVAVMDGWKRSRGARLETFTAHLNSKPVVYADTMEPVAPEELAEAWTQGLFV